MHGPEFFTPILRGMKTTLVAIFHSRMVTTLLGLKLSSVEKEQVMEVITMGPILKVTELFVTME